MDVVHQAPPAEPGSAGDLDRREDEKGSVLAFGTRAQQLQHRSDAGELSKGQEVSLIGYQHTREQPTREGTKTVTEIYAVAVTRR